MTRGLKKYENLASEVLEGSTRFSYFFCHVYEGFFKLTKISYYFLGGGGVGVLGKMGGGGVSESVAGPTFYQNFILFLSNPRNKHFIV